MGTLSPRIALIHDFLYTFGGAERVLLELHKLYPEAPIHTAFYKDHIVKAHFPNAKLVTSSLHTSWRRRSSALIALAMPRAIEEFNLRGFDIVISSSGAYSHGVLTGPETIHICYCHSPMRYAWDWFHEGLLERGLQKGMNRFLAIDALSNLRLWDTVAAKRVDVWLANSSTVKNRIAKFYRQKSEVVYPPVNTDYFDPATTEKPQTNIVLPKQFIFAACRLVASKRVDWLIELAAKHNVPLVIAGEGPQQSLLEAQARSQKAEVHFLGYISEAEKRWVMSQARCFMFPIEDDFGIAPVEAMSLGIPVIAYGRGGATETVVDGKSGILFLEPTFESLSSAFTQAWNHGVSWSAEEIRQHATTFSTETFRQKISALVEKYAAR